MPPSLNKMVLLMVKIQLFDKPTLSMCSPTIQLNLTQIILLKLQTAYINGVREDTHAKNNAPSKVTPSKMSGIPKSPVSLQKLPGLPERYLELLKPPGPHRHTSLASKWST